MQNGYVERCNGNTRRELLNAYVFKTLNEVREKAEQWMMDYNQERPHEALNSKAPRDLITRIDKLASQLLNGSKNRGAYREVTE